MTARTAWRPYEPSREAEAMAYRSRAIAAWLVEDVEFPCDRCKAKAGAECEEWCEP